MDRKREALQVRFYCSNIPFLIMLNFKGMKLLRRLGLFKLIQV